MTDTPLHVVYDASVLGLALADPAGRTGIYRAVENVALGLAAAPACTLSLVALHSWEALAGLAKYLETSPLDRSRLSDHRWVTFLRHLDHHRRAVDHSLGVLASAPRDLSLLPGRLNLRIQRKLLSWSLSPLLASAPRHAERALRHVDVFHSPYFPLPNSLPPATTARFLTVYDVLPILHPEWFTPAHSELLRRAVAGIQPEDWVLTISESSRNDLCAVAPHLDPAHISVTPLAASPLFHPCKDSEQTARIRHEYGIPSDASYFLSVATLVPRKNLAAVVRAFTRIANEPQVAGTYLVLVGAFGWRDQEFFDTFPTAQVRDRILLTGYVRDADLAPLYSDAVAFIYPSLYEGFGLPPLEAMQCGAPVIASNTSALPEVVGDAGILLDPTDHDALADKMLLLLDDPARRADLSARGLARARNFTWDATTQATLRAYHNAREHTARRLRSAS